MKSKDKGIKSISLENFRVFKDKCDFELAPITILTGANSSGKSSIIKALNLLQGFYEKADFEKGTNLILDFNDREECLYHHHLGDFNNVKNDQSKKNDISITYKIEQLYGKNLWGNLYVENVFCLDENSKFKKGRLKTSSVYVEDNKKTLLIGQLINENENINHFFNKPIVIKIFQSLIKEYLHYKKIFNEYIVRIDRSENCSIKNGDVKTIKDYTGPITLDYECFSDGTNSFETLKGYYPDAKHFCDFKKMDYEKFIMMNFNSGIEPAYENISFGKPRIKDYINIDLDTEYVFNNNIGKLVAQIPFNEYNNFEQQLWDLMLCNEPEIINTYNSINSLKKVFERIDDYFKKKYDEYGYTNQLYPLENGETSINSIKEFILKSGSKDFKSFYEKMDMYSSNNENLYAIQVYFDLLQHQLNWDRGIKKVYDYGYLQTYNDKGVNKFLTEARQYLINRSYEQIQNYLTGLYFIESVRANSQRLYTFSSQGTSFNQFLAKFLDKKYPTDFINKWIKEFEIGDAIDTDKGLLAGVGTQLILKRDTKENNIVDLGYGVIQFLSMLLRIVYAEKEGFTTIVIEEPESNLHPNLQSKLAELFMDAYKTFGVKFVIETHSEYLIWKLQYLTAKGEIAPEDTVIHYIGNPDAAKRESDEEQVRTIHIKQNGQRTRPFGSGFMDESSKWIKAMFTYSSQN